MNLILNQSLLKRDGKRLMYLALLGQVVLLLGMIAAPWILFAIGTPNPMQSAGSFPDFFIKAHLSGPTAAPNLYVLLQSCVTLLALDQARRLGKTLSGEAPLGEPTIRYLRWLSYTLLALILMQCVSVDAVHDVNVQPVPFRTAWTFSSSPLYIGAMVWFGLSIVRRIVAQNVALHAESEGFV
jgi:hypothetical protein